MKSKGESSNDDSYFSDSDSDYEFHRRHRWNVNRRAEAGRENQVGPDLSLNSKFQPWLQFYVNLRWFGYARKVTINRTGFDIQWLLNGYHLYEAGSKILPAILDLVQKQETSKDRLLCKTILE